MIRYLRCYGVVECGARKGVDSEGDQPRQETGEVFEGVGGEAGGPVHVSDIEEVPCRGEVHEISDDVVNCLHVCVWS